MDVRTKYPNRWYRGIIMTLGSSIWAGEFRQNLDAVVHYLLKYGDLEPNAKMWGEDPDIGIRSNSISQISRNFGLAEWSKTAKSMLEDPTTNWDEFDASEAYWPFIYLTAPSGAGKTTLVQAGLSFGYAMIDADVFGYRDKNDDWVIDMKYLCTWSHANPGFVVVGCSSNWWQVAHYALATIVYRVSAEEVAMRGVARDIGEGRAGTEKTSVKDANYYFDHAVKFYYFCERAGLPEILSFGELVRLLRPLDAQDGYFGQRRAGGEDVYKLKTPIQKIKINPTMNAEYEARKANIILSMQTELFKKDPEKIDIMDLVRSAIKKDPKKDKLGGK